CDVYRSVRHDEMYLYVAQKDGLSRVPAELLERFGKAEKTLTLVMTGDRHLARENANKVMANIDEHGYHLQLPPLKTDRLAEFRAEQERLRDE
ncbi:MAG: YcgL domain-containing protein, partial [Pseudomonadales bacterium]|nr:YcgL domain-containing protein [Pseudomonadales bacterium]